MIIPRHIRSASEQYLETNFQEELRKWFEREIGERYEYTAPITLNQQGLIVDDIVWDEQHPVRAEGWYDFKDLQINKNSQVFPKWNITFRNGSDFVLDSKYPEEVDMSSDDIEELMDLI